MMKKYLFAISMGFILLVSTSCKSEFEKIRVSGDAAEMHKKAFEYYENGEYNKAQTLLEIVLGSYRGKVEAEKIYYYYAQSQFKLKKYILASYYFKDFTKKFVNSEYREDAEFMTAYSNFKMSPNHRLDQSYTKKAIEGFQLFVNTYPNSERVSECNKLIDEMREKQEEKAYAEGELYFNLKQYQAAIKSFENLLINFPETKDNERVRYMMVRSNFLFANNSIVTKQRERLQETISMGDAFKLKYPSSSYQKELDNIYKICNKKLKELKDDRYQI